MTKVERSLKITIMLDNHKILGLHVLETSSHSVRETMMLVQWQNRGIFKVIVRCRQFLKVADVLFVLGVFALVDPAFLSSIELASLLKLRIREHLAPIAHYVQRAVNQTRHTSETVHDFDDQVRSGVADHRRGREDYRQVELG